MRKKSPAKQIYVQPQTDVFDPTIFSRGDMDWSGPDNSGSNTSPNVVRDAVITYHPTTHSSFVFGQTKLPGKRENEVTHYTVGVTKYLRAHRLKLQSNLIYQTRTNLFTNSFTAKN